MAEPCLKYRKRRKYNEIKVRFDNLSTEKDDLISATDTLQKGIIEIDKEARTKLRESFEKVNNNFKLLFTVYMNLVQTHL